MRLELVKFTCGHCGTVFKELSLGEAAYGEFLLRSKTGRIVYLNANEDPTFKEVDGLLALHKRTRAISPLERAKVVRRIYGALACDPDERGSEFALDADPVCPMCGSQQIEAWEFLGSPEPVDIEIPPVTHAHWASLSPTRKAKLLNECLSELAGRLASDPPPRGGGGPEGRRGK